MLTANLLAQLGDPVDVGIAVGSQVAVGDLGIWGYALILIATGAEALSVAVAYVSLAISPPPRLQRHHRVLPRVSPVDRQAGREYRKGVST